MPGLNNSYVESLSKKCIRNFKAVLPCDLFRNISLNVGDRFIVNLAKSDMLNNGHYIAICVNADHYSYFDSYGMPCYNEDVLTALHQIPNFPIRYSSKSIQGPFSYFCGFFSICYLICNEMNLSRVQFDSLFHDRDAYKNLYEHNQILPF